MIPDSDEIVDFWGAWLIGAIVASFAFGYACAADNRVVIVLALVLTIFCSFEARRLHRRDVDETRARARIAARLRGLP